MLRRLTLGFVSLAAAGAFVACSSNGTNPISVGPNFPTASLYATNTSQNAVSIYLPGTASGAGPTNQIGGSNTQIAGPQYIAFDSFGDLYVTNYAQSTGLASIVVIKALATGNVLPINVTTQIAHPRGIAVFAYPTTSTTPNPQLAVSNVNAAAGTGVTSQILLYNATLLGTPYTVIAGPNTGLNVPSGLAVDTNDTVYVANLQGASVEGFTLPTPAPTPSTTATPSPTPSPTPTPNPSASPSATPSATPIPTATPLNLAPTFTISGAATGIVTPTSVALDSAGNIYVSDQGNPNLGIAPAVLVFSSGLTGSVSPAPVRKISGSATLLLAPTDVKVDSSGKIYVADSTPSGAGVVYVYAATANGNVAPAATLTSPGAVNGLALSP
ncbi:MAG: NHL repeat-containing protein [Vulcanimicrobiaceae bacterium]